MVKLYVDHKNNTYPDGSFDKEQHEKSQKFLLYFGALILTLSLVSLVGAQISIAANN